jgi:hypothetical protein
MLTTMTEIIVNKIVDLVNVGEHDANGLAESVLNDLMDDSLPPPSGQPHLDPRPRA